MKTKTQQKNINILIVDDHQMFIDGIKTLLRPEKNIRIIAEALNGVDAISLIEKNTAIDMVIADIEMPEMNGIDLTKKIKAEYPNIKVLVLTMYKDSEIINEIAMAEAEGYILKNTGKKELIEAINRICNNGIYYSSEVVEILKRNDIIKKERNAVKLTNREKEIMALICKEYTTREIANKLFVGHHCIETHRRNIREKLEINNLVGTIKWVLANMPELLEDENNKNDKKEKKYLKTVRK